MTSRANYISLRSSATRHHLVHIHDSERDLSPRHDYLIPQIRNRSSASRKRGQNSSLENSVRWKQRAISWAPASKSLSNRLASYTIYMGCIRKRGVDRGRKICDIFNAGIFDYNHHFKQEKCFLYQHQDQGQLANVPIICCNLLSSTSPSGILLFSGNDLQKYA